MKRTILFVVLVAFAAFADAQTIFVNQHGTGDGSSWASATNNLSKALAQAQTGQQVWVAKGTYLPTNSTDRNASFVISKGIQIFGGFSGTESTIEERNITSNPTILSGEIGQPGIADNSYTVVLINNVSATITMDGFVISDGAAMPEGEATGKTKCGAGMYLDGTNGSINAIIKNCEFKNNKGMEGGAIYVNGKSGQTDVTLENCTFTKNEVVSEGGAIYNDGRDNGNSTITLSDCIFSQNVASYGGAIYNASDAGNCNLIMENCTLNENVAWFRGGAIFCMNGEEKCYMETTSSTFAGNYPDDKNMGFTSKDARANGFKIQSAEKP